MQLVKNVLSIELALTKASKLRSFCPLTLIRL